LLERQVFFEQNDLGPVVIIAQRETVQLQHDTTPGDGREAAFSYASGRLAKLRNGAAATRSISCIPPVLIWPAATPTCSTPTPSPRSASRKRSAAATSTTCPGPASRLRWTTTGWSRPRCASPTAC